MFKDDLMYGRVFSVPRPSANKFYFTINQDMSRLPDGFTISHYHLCTSVSNTHALKLNLQIAINRDKTCNYTFTEPRS